MSTEKPSVNTLCDKLMDRLGWINSMALQVGSERFTGWSDEVRDDYANAMGNYLQEATQLVEEIHARSKA